MQNLTRKSYYFPQQWQGYIRNYTWCNRTSLRELPLSISANLNVHYVPISNRLSSSGNQVHAFYTTVIFTGRAWSIINIIFLPYIMPKRKLTFNIHQVYSIKGNQIQLPSSKSKISTWNEINKAYFFCSKKKQPIFELPDNYA